MSGVALPDLGMVEIRLERGGTNSNSAVEGMVQEISHCFGMTTHVGPLYQRPRMVTHAAFEDA